MGLAVGFPSNVGTGVLDGPPPTRRSSLSGICYLRTVEDAGPYEYDLFVGFKQTEKPQFEEHPNRSIRNHHSPFSSSNKASKRSASSYSILYHGPSAARMNILPEWYTVTVLPSA